MTTIAEELKFLFKIAELTLDSATLKIKVAIK